MRFYGTIKPVLTDGQRVKISELEENFETADGLRRASGTTQL